MRNWAIAVIVASAVSATSATTPAFAEDWGQVSKLRAFVSRDVPDETTKQLPPIMTNARLIEANPKLMRTAIYERPWSSTFWPDMTGSVAYPYAEGWKWPLSWGPNRGSLYGRASLHGNIEQLTDQQIATLSPAEKYDYLIGDTNFTFTRQVLARIDQLSSVYLLKPILAAWSGICHGWSAAALSMPRPTNAFTAFSPKGRPIPFYPADIKALASISWGDAFGPGGGQNFVKVEGFQCRSGAKSDKYGRLLDPKCFDVNPAFFHLLMVNQIGLNKRGFVMDRNYRSEVQNQPVFAYDLKYYSLRDRRPDPGYTLDEAKVYVPSRYWDPYSRYRSPRTKALVGVQATVWYGMENDSVQTLKDLPEYDKTKTMTFKYDLELDDNDEIVGGEWREYDDVDHMTVAEQAGYQHPDIIWLVPPFVEPFSLGDWDIKDEQWDGMGPVPDAWRVAALKSSMWSSKETINGIAIDKLYPQPLLRVVKKLLERSRK